MGDRLVDLLLTGLNEGSPGASEHCVVYLVSRSASDPDVVHAPRAGPARRTTTGSRRRGRPGHRGADRRLLAKESEYTDYVPVRGKAAF